MNYLFLFSYLSPLTPIPNLALNLAFWMEMGEGCAHSLRSFRLPSTGGRTHSLLKSGKVLIPHSNIYIYITLYMAERGGCAHSLRSFRLPAVAEPIPLRGKSSSLIPVIYITMYMAEREGFEPSIPL